MASQRPSGDTSELSLPNVPVTSGVRALRAGSSSRMDVVPSACQVFNTSRPSGSHASGDSSMSEDSMTSSGEPSTGCDMTSKSPFRIVMNATRRPSGCQIGAQFMPVADRRWSAPLARSVTTTCIVPP